MARAWSRDGPWPHSPVLATWTPCQSATAAGSQVAENDARSSPPTSPGSTCPPEWRHSRGRNDSTASATKPSLHALRAACACSATVPVLRAETRRSSVAAYAGFVNSSPARGALPPGSHSVRRGRPVGLEEPAHPLDRGCDAREERVALPGVADGRLQHRRQRQRPVVAEQQEPGVDRPGDGRGQGTGARHVVQAHRGERLAGGARRRWALAAQHAWRRVVGRGDDRGEVAARPVEVRLDHVQHEPARDRCVERVPAELQHPLGRLGGQPVCRGDHPEGAREGGAGGEGHRCSSGCTRSTFSVVASMS